jgi:molybdopterin-binding protein
LSIEFKEVSKKYGEITALDKVNLRISEGEIFTLMGPNGSGKSTILRIMAGIESTSTGEMYFNKERIDTENLGQLRQNCTLVFQKTVLFNTSVEKNVAYGLKLRNYASKEIEELVKEALETVKLQGYEKRLARKLSGGEQQRVSLARALVLNTDLLLLDEPTANLDPRNSTIVEQTISRINQELGKTVVMATHNIFQVESLTNRAALLVDGRIAQAGTTQEIFRSPSKSMASFARVENVFSGYSEMVEGVSHIDIGGLVVKAAFDKVGEISVYVRPEDIILSLNPVMTSARNQLKGRIVSVEDMENVVRLRIDAGKIFVVQITRRSLLEFNLGLGSEVYLSFKASSVEML